MGCGASTSDKDAIKPLPESNLTQPEPELIIKTQKTPAQQNNKGTSNNNLGSSIVGKKDANVNKSTVDIKMSNMKVKRTDSVKMSGAESPAKSLRDSSLGKSQKLLNDQKSSKKNLNPEAKEQHPKLKRTESVIKQQSQIRESKVEQKLIKKTKSVKNHKELTNLIKVYGL